VLTGTVYQPDGRTPAVGARLYVYQTDASGIYGPQGSRRPRLRGWIRTGADGRYEIRTIRPGSYPGGRVAAHIHATLGAPDHPERWIDSFLFEGDPYLTGRERARAEGQGRFSPIVSIEKCQDGVWRGTRDLRLER
jgi:protocatechuate 3,4-dioxygenase beta subunit